MINHDRSQPCAYGIRHKEVHTTYTLYLHADRDARDEIDYNLCLALYLQADGDARDDRRQGHAASIIHWMPDLGARFFVRCA